MKITGIIDPPGAYASKDEWQAFLADLRALPPSPEVDAEIAEATAALARAPAAEDDDFSDLA